MSLKNLFYFLLVLNLFTIIICFALPSQKVPLALNLHQNLSPYDINGLTREQRVKAALDVETTVSEVQKLLALDPTLPRLTKGEIRELFETATRDELEKSILNGDKSKQQQMNQLLQALPYHKKEIEALEQLSQVIATTERPKVAPEIPNDLKKLLKQYGLLDKEGKPIEIAPLPVALRANDPKSTLKFDDDHASLLLDKYQQKVKAVIKPEDYETFKPLKVVKQNSSSSAEVELILKQFGLTDDQNSAKKVKTNTSNQKLSKASLIDPSHLMSGYSSLLENMGISSPSKSGKNSATRSSTKHKNHANNEDYKNLQHLLETIKELERLNKTLTEKEVEKLNLKNFNFSDSLLKNGPDPVEYQNHFSALKNEVKRRQSGLGGGEITPLLESSLEASDDEPTNEEITTKKSAPTTTTVKTTTTVATTTKATTTTTERTTTEAVENSTQEKKNTLEDDLEPVDDPAPLPPPRRSGFYMLFDWNSFFEVGEDEQKIKVRFDPKIGDPSRFLPVTIP